MVAFSVRSSENNALIRSPSTVNIRAAPFEKLGGGGIEKNLSEGGGVMKHLLPTPSFLNGIALSRKYNYYKMKCTGSVPRTLYDTQSPLSSSDATMYQQIIK